MRIVDLKKEHPGLYNLAMQRQEQAVNPENDQADLWDTSLAFEWDKTEEGQEFWDFVNLGRFNEVYEAHPTYRPSVKAKVEENKFKKTTDSLASLLQYKNEKYGNSALKPLNVFANKTKVGQRLDDKLARIKNSDVLRKNDVADMLGYLLLVCEENGWDNFDEFKD